MPMLVATLRSTLLSAAGTVRRHARAFQAWRQAREDYRMLWEMDDRTLSDLGLTRADLRDATAIGYFADPTAIVAGRAAERAGARRPTKLAGPSIVPDAAAALRVPAACS